MEAHGEYAPGDGLRQLSRMVIDDDVSSETLTQYLHFILEDRLVELDAHARSWPTTLRKGFSNLSASDLAALLISRADELDGRKCG